MTPPQITSPRLIQRLVLSTASITSLVLVLSACAAHPSGNLDPQRDQLQGLQENPNAAAQAPPSASGKADTPALLLPRYGEGDTLHIRFAGFIPCDVLGPGPLGEGISDLADFYLEGDGREFSFDAARDQSRASISALISRSRIEATHEHMGPSRAYRDDELSPRGDAWSEFARCFSSTSTAVPYFEHTDDDPQIDTWHATQDENAEWTLTKTTFRIRATGQTPLGEFPCSLDGLGHLYVWWDSAGIARHYDLRVNHDAFPAYELYLNEQAIFLHDPRETGHSPLDLCLPATQVHKQVSGPIA